MIGVIRIVEGCTFPKKKYGKKLRIAGKIIVEEIFSREKHGYHWKNIFEKRIEEVREEVEKKQDDGENLVFLSFYKK